MDVCGEGKLNHNRFVVGIPYAADHETVECIVAVMRCTKTRECGQDEQTSKQEKVVGSSRVIHQARGRMGQARGEEVVGH